MVTDIYHTQTADVSTFQKKNKGSVGMTHMWCSNNTQLLRVFSGCFSQLVVSSNVANAICGYANVASRNYVKLTHESEAQWYNRYQAGCYRIKSLDLHSGDTFPILPRLPDIATDVFSGFPQCLQGNVEVYSEVDNLFIYLITYWFLYSLFNHVSSSSDYIASNKSMIGEW